MHSMKGDNYTYHYNSDGSGDVKVVNNQTDQQLYIPFAELAGLIATVVRGKKIAQLEQASDYEILTGMPTPESEDEGSDEEIAIADLRADSLRAQAPRPCPSFLGDYSGNRRIPYGM